MRTPSIFSIFFPRFACKSITFILTIIHVILFAILLIYNYSQAQNDLTWNCSLFQLQNKYYPKLRYQYQIWRVFISAFFHSNIAHFVLNLFGLQVYGYFVEWHYGKIKYILLLVFTVIFSHFLAAITNQISISTTSSSLLFAIIALKIYFLYEYRQYKKL
jgi:membrane associated rhomboid family serine protease